MTIKALFNAKSGVREREMIRVERDGQAEQSTEAEIYGGDRAEQCRDENYSPEMTIKALFNAKSGVREREMIKGISCGQAEQSSGAEKSRCGRAEQWRDGTHRPGDGRAEQWGDDSQADQTSMEPGRNWNDS